MIDDNTMDEAIEAVEDGNLELFRSIVMKNPEILDEKPIGRTWLQHAATSENAKIIDFLVEMGMNVNEELRTSLLFWAITADSMSAAKALLEYGASPNQQREVITAANSKTRPIEWLDLLIKYGADLNELYEWDTTTHTVLSWALLRGKTEVAEFLASHGAKLPSDVGNTL